MASESTQVREVESLRLQLRVIRWSTIIIVAVIVVSCLVRLNSSVRGLAQAGETQEEFVSTLRQNLNQELAPRIQQSATETLTEIQPEVQKAINKLKDRLPEITEVATHEMDALQTNLPKRGEAVLDRTFTAMLTSKEGTIRKLYPDLTEDQTKLLVLNLADEGRRQLTAADVELFAAHQAKLKSILGNLETIKQQEAANTKKIQPSWDMAILLLDILRDDLKDLQHGAEAAPKPIPAKQPIKS